MICVNKNIVPFFSVIITSYNRSGVLKRALDSLIMQSTGDWECLIVDDGSNDSTFEIAKIYCDNDPRIRYLYHANRKQAMSKNAGILAASGLFITFLDSDDEYEPNHLELRQSVLRQNPSIEFLDGGFRIVGNNYVPDANNHNKMIHLSHCKIGGTFFIRRDAAFDISGFPDVEYGDDTAFYERVEQFQLMKISIDNPTYIYHRDSEDSLCNNFVKKVHE